LNRPPRPPAVVYFKLMLSTLFWGGAFIAGRHLAQQVPHFVAATGRFVAMLAGGAMVVFGVFLANRSATPGRKPD